MHKGFGFIEYEEYEDCLHAIENMNDAEICGRVLRVSMARPQRFKESYRPIWMEEDFHKKHSKVDNASEEKGQEKDEKKIFA